MNRAAGAMASSVRVRVTQRQLPTTARAMVLKLGRSPEPFPQQEPKVTRSAATMTESLSAPLTLMDAAEVPMGRHLVQHPQRNPWTPMLPM